MSSDQPPPYGNPPPFGPFAPGFPAGSSSHPAAFPGQPYQGYPSQGYHAQGYAGGGDPSYPYYQGPPGPLGPPGAPGPYLAQPGYQGYQRGPPGPQYTWDGAKGGPLYGEPAKNTVYMVEGSSQAEGRGRGGVGGMEACLGACMAALCCCCLWDMFT